MTLSADNKVTVKSMIKWVLSAPVLPNRLPAPFAGRKHPTRVIWHISKSSIKPEGRVNTHLTYYGKPNTYRARQALNFMNIKPPMEVIKELVEIELDAQGPIYYSISAWDREREHQYQRTFTTHMRRAFHLHGDAEPTRVFAEKVIPKHIGGRTVYSMKAKLPTREIENYYQMYQTSFGQNLKRPKRRRRGGPEQLSVDV